MWHRWGQEHVPLLFLILEHRSRHLIRLPVRSYPMAQAAMEDAKGLVHATNSTPSRERTILLHPCWTPCGFGTFPSWNSGGDPRQDCDTEPAQWHDLHFSAVSN